MAPLRDVIEMLLLVLSSISAIGATVAAYMHGAVLARKCHRLLGGVVVAYGVWVLIGARTGTLFMGMETATAFVALSTGDMRWLIQRHRHR